MGDDRLVGTTGKGVKEEGISGYLKKGWRESRWRRIARYRVRNEMRESRY